MSQRNDRQPPFGPLGGLGGGGGSNGWDDWDPDEARRGYTGHVRALRDLDLRPGPLIDLPTPVNRPGAPGGVSAGG
ncbi:MAG: hypothetical protein ACRDHE_03565, partial [Ktedonobacterales bacterium]